MQREQIILKRLTEKKLLIQVVLGPRQVGKTTAVLAALKSYKGISYYVAAEDSFAQPIQWIEQQWQKAKLRSDNCLLVIDEIQKIPNWSEEIKRLWDQEQRKNVSLKVLLLGSSSLQLQKGLSESLTGRFELIEFSHWNFSESKSVFKMSLKDYLKFGGYPGSYRFIKNPKRWQQFMNKSIIETVIDKDILRLAQVRSPALFRQSFRLLMSYPAQEISYTKLLGQLQDKGNTDLVKYYIELFEGAYLLKALQKYSSKAVLKRSSSPKILPLCPALIDHALSPSLEGFRIESVVGAELSRLGVELFYWRDNQFEVDFVFSYENQLIALEVKSGRKKNPRGLEKFKELYPKAKSIFVTMETLEIFLIDPKKYLQKLI